MPSGRLPDPPQSPDIVFVIEQDGWSTLGEPAVD